MVTLEKIRLISWSRLVLAIALFQLPVGQTAAQPLSQPPATASQSSTSDPDTGQDGDQELDPEYLKKWTPIRRTDSRFPYEDETDADWVDDRYQKMDTGPTFCGSIKTPGKGMTPKAIAIRLGSDDDPLKSAVLFDTQQLNVLAGWTGDFLNLPPKRFGMLEMPSVKGNLKFTSDWERGWSWQNELGTTETTRAANSRFEKYTLNGNQVELAYNVNGTSFLETNAVQILSGAQIAFRRLIKTPKNDRELVLSLVSTTAESFRKFEKRDAQAHVITQGDKSWIIRLDGVNTSLRHHVTAGNVHQVSVVFPKSDTPQVADLAILPCETGSIDELIKKELATTPQIQQPQMHQPRWGEPIPTVGKRATDDQPLVVDEITVPYENRFNALMYTSGFDFLPDGTAMVCTMHGDVWRVAGVDDDLDEITWQRFATGLYQPLGLKVVDGVVHVLGRDRITVLKDLNGDGEADEYQNFCDLLHVTGQPHAYAMSLETDSAGNFYFIKSGGSPPHGGTMAKVSPDGKQIEVVATGYRHANGMGVGPNDEVTSADNEGNWMPTTRIDLVHPGGFYGHMPTHRRDVAPETYDGPLCWVPRLIDNSAGGQVWVNSDSWGPLNGKMLHLSFGRCTANLVLMENVNGVDQAGILKLDLPTFLSGSMRGRFNSRDGHLYLAGLDGWQTAAIRDGCFQRVRATGKPIYLPVDLKVKETGIEITFSQPLDAQDATKLANWDIQQWNYRWTSEYGSDHYRVTKPDEVGHDSVPISAIEISPDRRTVTFKVNDLKPVMQMQITGKIKAADGTLVPVQLFPTIHAVGK